MLGAHLKCWVAAPASSAAGRRNFEQARSLGIEPMVSS
jgi:hypothetical protein